MIQYNIKTSMALQSSGTQTQKHVKSNELGILKWVYNLNCQQMNKYAEDKCMHACMHAHAFPLNNYLYYVLFKLPV